MSVYMLKCSDILTYHARKRIMKKLTVTAGVVVTTLVLGVGAVLPAQAFDDDVPLEETEVITEAAKIVEFYTHHDVTAADLPVIDVQHNTVLEEVINLALDDLDALAELDPSIFPPVSPNSSPGIGAQLGNALAKATMNNTRDAYAGGLHDEAVYMFMSHYVDIPQAGGGVAQPNLYADWITNSDRQTYDNFLASIDFINASVSMFDIFDKSTTIATTASNAIKRLLNPQQSSANILLYLMDSVNLAQKGDDLKNALQNLQYALNDNKSAAEIILNLEASLQTNWERPEYRKAIIGSMAALAMGSFGGAMFALGIGALQFVVTGFEGLAIKAAVNGMGYTRSGRVAMRLWRSMGLG